MDNRLNDNDIYSLSMFLLYKLSEIPEYTTISELPYVLDKKNLLRFCDYFGGSTLKVPTTDEIQSLMCLLMLYQNVKVDKIDFNTALALIGYNEKDVNKIKKSFEKLCKVLDDYDIKPRTNF